MDFAVEGLLNQFTINPFEKKMRLVVLINGMDAFSSLGSQLLMLEGIQKGRNL